ncbi:hypothetical protein F5Y13DRAFT_51033 [Hypoxylon sp. FL1857]|nr:hypothetical protein F5Y13DRAFT_51033 [Hypoxylon sp. FL1857]
MLTEDQQPNISKKGPSAARRNLASGMLWRKPKTASQLTESFKTDPSQSAGQPNRQVCEYSSSATGVVERTPQSPSTSPVQQWSIEISSQPAVKDGFERLRTAIDEYNVEASQQQRDLIDHQNVQLEEVRKIAEGIQLKSNSGNSEKKIRSMMNNGLRKFCETSLYYSSIMDILIQQNPEWLSLAWGAVKFMLMIPIEYQRVKENIAVHLGSLGEKFAVVHIFTQFFPSVNIINAAAAMYTSFAEFLETSVRWLSDNQFKRIIKSTFRPFDTSLKPILDKINHSYTVLKEHVEVQKLIKDYQLSQQHHEDLKALKTSSGTTDQKLTRVLQILEGLIMERQQAKDPRSAETRRLPIKASKQRSSVLLLPALRPKKTFAVSLEPMDQDLNLMQTRQALSPIMKTYEGIDVLQRYDFRKWASNEVSGLLWVDGYEKPGRPSWLGDMALRVTQAALISGYEALYTFNSLRFKEHEAFTPLGLIQRLSNHLLNKYPEIYELGDAEILCPEIFFAAETDIGLSWKIFVECLTTIRPAAIYIIVEAIDGMQLTPSNREQFQSILQRFSQLTTPGAGTVKNKIIKIMITSTKPDAGFDIIFGEPGSKNTQDVNSTHVLVRVSPAAARSRKQRSMPGVKRRVRIPSNSHAMAGLTFQCEKILTDDDFLPEPEGIEPCDIAGAKEDVKQQVDSDEDFDIFEETSTSYDMSGGKAPPMAIQAGMLDRNGANYSFNMSAMSSDSSLDIFGDG